MSLIKLKIVTPEKTVYEGGIKQITLPVSDGEVTILPNHRSYIASLKAGEICLKTDGDDLYMAVSGGFIEFDQNNLVVLADTAERADEIDIERAEQARKRAEELKKERIEMDDGEYARVAAAIEKELARIKVGRKNRTRRSMTLD
ncbi:MAG: F0F1 ATP synthase subunit epsilon [Candidatus Moranbacteria bacterium]|jgi:F-type H+-transporting ATPase subunit epsilon|nr:F0F1 ATP synthase subunit epsilon [Candidatus Moranbacteria bacterium]